MQRNFMRPFAPPDPAASAPPKKWTFTKHLPVIYVRQCEAADRDCVAQQYAENFVPLFERIVPNLRTAIQAGMTLADAIVHVHLQTLHAFPDSLIARKCGIAVAEEASRRAGEVLSAGPQPSAAYQQALQMLDRYLRDERHQRNPGTTADLLAAGLFTLLRDGIIEDAQAFNKRVHYADQPH